MFLTFDDQFVHFEYGPKAWRYPYGDIEVLGMLRKKRMYYFEKTAAWGLSAALYYYLFFTDMDYLLFVIPAASLLITAGILRYRTAPEFAYYVILKTRSGFEQRIKINVRHKKIIAQGLAHYEGLKFQNRAPAGF
jgi:hypothetical protein